MAQFGDSRKNLKSLKDSMKKIKDSTEKVLKGTGNKIIEGTEELGSKIAEGTKDAVELAKETKIKESLAVLSTFLLL